MDKQIRTFEIENLEQVAKAIEVFKENLENLLLIAPMKDKNVLGFDPAYRTGCKIAVIDSNGKFLFCDVGHRMNKAVIHLYRQEIVCCLAML